MWGVIPLNLLVARPSGRHGRSLSVNVGEDPHATSTGKKEARDSDLGSQVLPEPGLA
jgi:hypothetical protein